MYEDSINESRAQLQAITLIISTLQGAKIFTEDNYDVLITKAALHGAKLLKKPHQSTAVHLASHMWWQTNPALTEELASSPTVDKKEAAPAESDPAALEQPKKSVRVS